MGRRKIEFQLYELGSVGAFAKKMLTASGGVVYVAGNGDAAKQAITDVNGTALTNPRALTNGACVFYVPDTVASVDLFIQCPGGQFVAVPDVDESVQDIGVDTTRIHQVMVVPFSATDSTAAVETNTGFDFPLHAAVLPTPFVRVSAIDATETMDVGLLSSETAGDADGFINGLVLDNLGLVKATLLASGDTMGALLSVLDSANAGDDAPESHVITGTNATSVTYTLTTGSDTAKGYIYLPYLLMPAL